MNLLGTGTQRAAKTSRVQLGSGGAFLTFASFDVRVIGADLPTTNFESYNVPRAETFAEGIQGILSCDFSFGGAWDAGTKPTNNPPGLYPRDDLPNVNLITSRIDGTAWGFTYARIRGTTQGSTVEGLVLFNVNDAKNQGPFTYP
jgi:hypothetical protein